MITIHTGGRTSPAIMPTEKHAAAIPHILYFNLTKDASPLFSEADEKTRRKTLFSPPECLHLHYMFFEKKCEY